jgi:hypothetical protein
MWVHWANRARQDRGFVNENPEPLVASLRSAPCGPACLALFADLQGELYETKIRIAAQLCGEYPPARA